MPYHSSAWEEGSGGPQEESPCCPARHRGLQPSASRTRTHHPAGRSPSLRHKQRRPSRHRRPVPPPSGWWRRQYRARWGAAGSGSRAGGLLPADEGHPLGPCRRLRGARAPENSIFSPLARRPRRWAIAACGNRGVDAVRSADHQARSRACWERALHRGRLGTTTTTPASRVSAHVHGRSWWRNCRRNHLGARSAG